MLKVFYGHTTSIGGAYYRCMCYAFEMARQGIADPTYLDYDPEKMGHLPNPWEREWMLDPQKRDQIVESVSALVRQSDITVYQHFINPIGLAMLRMQQEEYKKPIVTEIDDYAFDIPALNASSESFRDNNEKVRVTRSQLKVSDALIVSTEYLKEQYSKYNKNIHVIPNCIDFTKWDGLQRNLKRGKIRIGHIAASGHLQDKQLLKEVIPHILNKYDNVEFIFVGDAYYPTWMQKYREQGRIKFADHWTNIIDYPKYLADFGFDIGIAPLCDFRFNRGKSNLRYLEYSALKMPTVASKVRPFVDTITHGKNGYLVTEAEDWIKSLEELIESEEKKK